ncbi:ubiquitin-like-specific protease 1 [Vitis riparia]|uniref:ubiquitin-like-specific protease 1 n=1 Tax=Vitis riparia TaxID=96939 RepID=UPI00155A1EDA|nr:ubiquitin-like-specific protease 1 [Vitis riparia]
MKTRTSRERKPSKFKVSPFVHNLRKMVKREASEQMILCGSPHHFFDRKTSIVSKYISELDDCEKLFIPMHDDCPGHWYLCVIDFKHFDIQILDSLRSKSQDEFRFKSVKIVVEFCQTFFKLYDIGKDVFQFSIDWAPSIPTQDNGWDCGVHVIRHMQRFKNGDSMMSSDFCNSVKIRREIACDLVLHEGNREKQTIVAIVCTKTSTRAMKKLLL